MSFEKGERDSEREQPAHEHEEWVQKAARIMKKKEAQIDHMKKKNEL